jgi:predicted Zn-dependent protease with MMP-like domain
VPKPSIYNRTLRKAADQLGGLRALARYLGIPLADLYAWMQPGAQPPPITVFLKAVDLVLNDLDVKDEERAQRVRVAVIHEGQHRAAVMQKLHDLLPDSPGEDTALPDTPRSGESR